MKLAFSMVICIASLVALPVQAQKTQATLRLDWVPGPHHIGPVLAAQRGYYAQEGLDISVRPGRGSGSTVQVIAAGTELFGFADPGAMALAVGKGAQLVMVANVTQLGPNGAITL